MAINKDKYLKELKKLGLDELKAKSFLYDLEKDLGKTINNPQIRKVERKIDKRRVITYVIMFVVMIIYLVWVFSGTGESQVVVNNITQNITS